MSFRIYHLSFILGSCLLACTNSSYEAGDSSLSYMKAEMVDIHAKNNAVQSIITDADESLPFESGLSLKGTTTPADTTYRMLLYYKKVSTEPITILSQSSVRLLESHSATTAITTESDPLTLTSIWQSENGKYINLNLGLKTGKADAEDVKQKIALVRDSVINSMSGKKHYFLSIRHDQNSVPEYYTATCYFSFPLKEITKGDSITFTIPTYNGIISHNFIKK